MILQSCTISVGSSEIWRMRLTLRLMHHSIAAHYIYVAVLLDSTKTVLVLRTWMDLLEMRRLSTHTVSWFAAWFQSSIAHCTSITLINATLGCNKYESPRPAFMSSMILPSRDGSKVVIESQAKHDHLMRCPAHQRRCFPIFSLCLLLLFLFFLCPLAFPFIRPFLLRHAQ